MPCGKPAQDSQTFPAGVTEAGILSLKAVTTAKTKLKPGWYFKNLNLIFTPSQGLGQDNNFVETVEDVKDTFKREGERKKKGLQLREGNPPAARR